MTQTASERIHALVTPDALQLLAGGRAPVSVVVTNHGRVVDQLQLQVEGLDPAWFSVQAAEVNLLPEDSGNLGLEVHVPPDAVAGAYRLHLTVRSQDDPGESVELDVPLEIQVQGALSLELVPAAVTTRRRGRFSVCVSNTSNVPRTVDLLASDPDEALELQLERDRVSLEPGLSATVWLLARPRQRPLIAPPRTLPFTVSALSSTELGEPLAGAQGRLVYTAPLVMLAALPARMRRLVLPALAALAVLAALIWLLGQPGLHVGVPEANPTPAPTPAAAAPAPQAAQPPAAAPAPVAPTPPPAPAAMLAPTPTALPLPTIRRFELVMPVDQQQTPPSLVWAVDGADAVTINGEAKPASGSEPIQPLANSQFELAARNGGGTVKKAVGVLVLGPPKIDSFTASATDVEPGQSVSVQWKAHGGERATLLGQAVDPSGGSGDTQLSQTATLTLVVENELGRDTRSILVTVRGAGEATPAASGQTP